MSSNCHSLPAESAVWENLRAYTPARIGLPRSGLSLSAETVLNLRAAHAAARDAVWTPLDLAQLARTMGPLCRPAIEVASNAGDRRNYLMRPDLGRSLARESRERLAELRGDFDLAVVAADGLSALAIQRHACPLLAALLPAIRETLRLAPLVIVEQGRVALGDEIAMTLNAAGVLMLIGERPGLSAIDSLGAYLTWGVKRGLTDADRNCISNIRPEGLGYEEAARQIAYLLGAVRKCGYSGVTVKDRADEALTPPG